MDSPLEKTSSVKETTAVEVNELQEALDGYVLDPALYPNNAEGLKTTPDGQYVLIPQPSDSEQDPLNWSPRKKAFMLAAIDYIAALADYTGGTAIITVIPQAAEWGMGQAAVQRAVVGNIFSIGACGLFVVALASYFGGLPVTLVFQAIFFATCAWSAAATSFKSYLAARIVNGLFCSVGQGGAIMWIKDLYFFHEHPRAINYVEFSIITSPYLGPLITAFIVSGTTLEMGILAVHHSRGHLACSGLLHGRDTIRSFHCSGEACSYGLPCSANSRHRTSQITTPAKLRPINAPPCRCDLKVTGAAYSRYYFLNFAWVIGLNTTVSIWLTEFYAFTPRGIGYFYFFGIVGPLLGWFIGHWMHDAVGRYYARRYGRIDPEARLLIAYPATLLLFVSLLVIGFALQHTWHYMILAVFSSLQTVGVMIVTTATNAYLLDCYPEGSGEVGAWITASRNWAGFMATFIQIEWVTSAGAAKAFGAQAGITIASMLILVILQLFGKKIRKAQGRMVFDKVA